MPDQPQRTKPDEVPNPTPGGGGGGPSTPNIDKPNTEDLLKRMKKVDPEQAKRYRQRTGQ